jgi:hypothetical protein
VPEKWLDWVMQMMTLLMNFVHNVAHAVRCKSQLVVGTLAML